MMDAEQTYRGRLARPLAAFKKLRELRADRAALVRETGQRDSRTAYLYYDRARAVEHMHMPM
jgi:hypothetical protein